MTLRAVTLKLEFPELPTHLLAMAEDREGLPQAAVYLPRDYDPERAHPCLIWLQGGRGGNGDQAGAGRAIVGDEGWVVINLPLFKRALEPLADDEGNKWHRLYISSDEGAHIWRCYRPMLERIAGLVPGLCAARSCIGGFSNGAHSLAALLNAGRPLGDWAHHCVFAEGGQELRAAKRIPGRLLVLQGDDWGGEQHDWLLPCAMRARAEGCAVDFERMAEVGHGLPEAWKRRLADWLQAWVATA